ncbi:NAD(P)/FAD-dependent oxidoreductase [Halosegnis marinus]|uniref:NAD(P)/FAD-dependent oxidoreductase n=1 Tax=Halosegnis marinus TaxID=3034023 RepID=A0ABD5ZT81_9EURY|nr:FAD-dependent oxidoreductase [Halosegnis sp. DT85]
MRIAIVGAGAAGAAAAYGCRDAEVVVFEAADRVGGRVASRERDGAAHDHGAGYLKRKDPRVERLLDDVLDEDGRVEITDPVWTFDAAGTIASGDGSRAPKLSFESGIDALVERLLDRSGATVETGTPVGSVAATDDGPAVRDGSGDDLGTFDAVVLTPPAPLTAELLPDDGPLGDLAEACRGVSYRPLVAVMLGYEFDFDPPWFALVNADRGHDCTWVARESAKPGHGAGDTVLAAQFSPEWTRERDDDPDDEVTAAAAEAVAALVGDDRLADPSWGERRTWEHALPNGAADADAVEAAEEAGVYCAGDWVAGEGRVHRALRSGLDAADRVQGGST